MLTLHDGRESEAFSAALDKIPIYDSSRYVFTNKILNPLESLHELTYIIRHIIE
jgi:hypothetical protein